MFTPLSWLLGRASPVPGLRVSAEHARRNAEGLRPTASSFLAATAWTRPRCCGPLWGRCRRRWGGPKEGAAGGRPSTRRHGARGLPQLSRPGLHILRAQQVQFQRRRTRLGLEVVGRGRGEQAPRPAGPASSAGTSSPPPAAPTVRRRDPGRSGFRRVAAARSPRPEGAGFVSALRVSRWCGCDSQRCRACLLRCVACTAA